MQSKGTRCRSSARPLQGADGSFNRHDRSRIPHRKEGHGAQAPKRNGEWEMGAWSSLAGRVCKFPGSQKALPIDKESSFLTLDTRAADILGRSLQALESSSSLSSCASAMTKTDSQLWEEKGPDYKVKRTELSSDHMARIKDKGIATTVGSLSDQKTSDILRTLREIINNCDYSIVKPSQDKASIVTKLSFQDQKLIPLKENVTSAELEDVATATTIKPSSDALFKTDALVLMTSNASSTVSNVLNKGPTLGLKEMCSKRPDEGVSGDAHKRRALPTRKISMRTKSRYCQPSRCISIRRSVRFVGTRQNIVHLIPCKTHDEGILPAHMKNSSFNDNMNVSRPKPFTSQAHDGAVNDSTGELGKLSFLSKPPKWKGLSAALSIVRSICNGESDVGVGNAQATPVLIVAGKCVFRTNRPLNTSRPRTTTLNRGAIQVPPLSSCNLSVEDTETTISHTNARMDLCPPTTGCTSSVRLPRTAISQTSTSWIKPWPPGVPELDNWISEIITEWLEKDKSQPFVTDSTCSNIWVSKEKQGVPDKWHGPPAMSIQVSKSLSFLLSEVKKTLVSPPSKHVTELDVRIGAAQTVNDLSHILASGPRQQLAWPFASDTGKVEVDRATTSIIQEFETDEVVQDFKRKMQVLAQEIQELKSSICKQSPPFMVKSKHRWHD